MKKKYFFSIIILLIICCSIYPVQKNSLVDEYNLLLEELSNYLTIGYISKFDNEKISIGTIFRYGSSLFTNNENDFTVSDIGGLFIRVQEISSKKYFYTISERFFKSGNFLISENGKYILASEIINNNKNEIEMMLFKPASKAIINRYDKYFLFSEVIPVKGLIINKTVIISNVDLSGNLIRMYSILGKINKYKLKDYDLKKQLISMLIVIIMKSELEIVSNNNSNNLYEKLETESEYDFFLRQRKYYNYIKKYFNYLKI
jgi:hypothetical protein